MKKISRMFVMMLVMGFVSIGIAQTNAMANVVNSCCREVVEIENGKCRNAWVHTHTNQQGTVLGTNYSMSINEMDCAVAAQICAGQSSCDEA